MSKPIILVDRDITYGREASKVKRCHTVPYHGEYTVGQHSHDALTLLFNLYPGNPSLDLIRAVHQHDYGERIGGDIPATACWNNAELNKAYEALQESVLEHYGYNFALSDEEQRWLKAIDRLELLLWAYDQVNLGNNHVRHYIDNLEEYFWERSDDIPPEVFQFFARYEWRRINERDGE